MATSPNRVEVRARRIIAAGIKAASSRSGRERLKAMAIHTHGYAEPGYQHADVIVTGNFNSVGRWEEVPVRWAEKDDAPKRVADLLGRIGAEVEWCDEWAACDWCRKLVRSQPDSHFWKPSFWRHPLGVFCHECVKSDPREYLKCLEGREAIAETLGVDLPAHGYTTVLDDCQYGLGETEIAQPKRIAETLRHQGVSRFVFRLDEVGPTTCTFSVCVHDSQLEAFDRTAFNAAVARFAELGACDDRARNDNRQNVEA